MQTYEKETSRLSLRFVEESDCADLYEYMSNHKVMQYMTMNPCTSIDEMQTLITNEYLKFVSVFHPSAWVLEEKATGKVIGHIELHSWFDHCAQVAYWLNPLYWKQGFMKEAMSAFCEIAFEQLHMHRLQANIAIRNVASHFVVLNCGFLKEGCLRKAEFFEKEYEDVVVYALLEEEWRKLHEKRVEY